MRCFAIQTFSHQYISLVYQTAPTRHIIAGSNNSNKQTDVDENQLLVTQLLRVTAKNDPLI